MNHTDKVYIRFFKTIYFCFDKVSWKIRWYHIKHLYFYYKFYKPKNKTCEYYVNNLTCPWHFHNPMWRYNIRGILVAGYSWKQTILRKGC